ncbi:MAG: PaaI family thioesterase [Crocinitomicaceae bacterium]
MLSPKEIVDKMMANDAMSQWLGIQIKRIEPGNVILNLVVKPEMTNGFGIAHGGITYSLSDTCIAFSANAYGRKAVSVETSISHLKPVKVGDVLTTEIEEINLTQSFGVYSIKIYTQNNVLVSVFKGTMYRKGDWI